MPKNLWCHVVARRQPSRQLRKHARIITNRRTFRPMLEGLEQRWLPAVTLTANQVALAGPVVAGVYSGTVDHFTETGRADVGLPNAQASDFTAVIDWNDGSPVSVGTVQAQPDGSFTVLGRHTYHEGSYFPMVTITDTVAAVGAGASTGSWISLPDMPTPRDGLAAVTGPDGRIYAIGGEGADHVASSTVEVYDPALNSWSTAAPMPTARQRLAAVVGRDGQIYAIGGIDATYAYRDTVEVYNVLRNTWSTAAHMNARRYDLGAAVSRDGRIFAIGGSNGSGNLSTVEVYDPATGAWTGASDIPVVSRSGLAAVAGPDGRIYAIGGDPGGTVDAYDPVTNTWDTVVAPLPTPRSNLAAVAGPGNLILAIGGYQGSGIGGLSAVEGYNPATNTWSLGPPILTHVSGLAAAVGRDGRIYAIGGRNESGLSPVTFEALPVQPIHVLHGSLTAGAINVVLTEGAPFSGAVVGFQSSNTLEQATDFTAVIHWGDGTPDSSGTVRGGALGQFTVSGSHTFAQTGTYRVLVDITDPAGVHVTAGGRFTWTSYPDMPAALGGSAAAASRDRIYALGGLNSSGADVPTVQVSDPATGLWSFAAPMPTPRDSLAAVTGTDGSIYAIGGYSFQSGELAELKTTEVYTPATDSWFSAAPMHSPRGELAAAAGPAGRIYAIGGRGTDTTTLEVDTVEVYDPATNRWSTAAHMPTARYGLAAVTGQDGRIYAIGGFNSSGYLGTVEVYDTVTDSWSTAAPMPSLRGSLAAVLGPDGRIYAIGGYNQGALTTVEAYDPRTNTWDTTPEQLPDPRTLPLAALGRDGRIYVLGGWGNHTGSLPTVQVLDYGSAATVAQQGAVVVTSPALHMHEVGIPTHGSAPFEITARPDGNLWFTEEAGERIGELDPTTHAVINEYPLPTTTGDPFGITSGPNGNLWFAESNRFGNSKIAEINPDTGAIQEFPLSNSGSNPVTLVSGPYHSLWFTEFWGNQIGELFPPPAGITSAVVNEFPIPTADSGSYGITAGPAGTLWFTEARSGKIAELNPTNPTTGVITEYATPTAGSYPEQIIAGPDGNLWFTEWGANQIGTINPKTGFIREFPIPTANSLPERIVARNDGNLWFTEDGANQIGAINLATGAIREFPIPTAGSSPRGIAIGPDGNLWFAEINANQIGEVEFTPTVSAMAGFNQTALIGTAYANPLMVLVTDVYGHPARNTDVVFTAPAAGAGGTFPGGSATATVQTDGNGVAIAPAFVANAQTGTFVVTASAEGESVSFHLTNTGATQLVVTGFPPVDAGTSATFTVTAVDQHGQIVTDYSGTVSFFATGTAGVPAPTTLTNGTGTFTATLYTAGLQALGASDGTISGRENAIIVATAATAQLSIVAGAVQSTLVNTAYAQPFEVLAADAYGNPISGTSVIFTAPLSGPSGTFGNSAAALVVTDAHGLATAPTFMANTRAGSFTVTASAGNSPQATFALTNNSGSPAALAVVGGSGQSVTVTKAYSTPLQVQITDAYGNPLAVAGVSVTFTAPATGAGGKFGTSTTATAVTNASGVATAPAFTANTKAGNFAVTAASGSLTAAPISLTNLAGRPVTIAVVKGTPQSTAAGSDFATNLQAIVKDTFGNPVSGVTVSFTIHSGRNHASATFGGSDTVTVTTDDNGLATALTLTANSKTGKFTVSAQASGVAPAATFTLTNTVPPAVRVKHLKTARPSMQVHPSAPEPASLDTNPFADWLRTWARLLLGQRPAAATVLVIQSERHGGWCSDSGGLLTRAR
jgi:streptogramin lyase/N-acetylneuraminic acid mutarotase